MIAIKNCGDAAKVTEEDYKALSQAERKRLGEIVKVMRVKDRSIPEKDLRERAYYIITADSVPFEMD
jgi:hypothetical protein